jgi:hypothetical protein
LAVNTKEKKHEALDLPDCYPFLYVLGVSFSGRSWAQW